MMPSPNYFHNSQECANKNLALFWLNSGHCFFHSVAGRIPHSSAVPAMTLQGWYECADLQAKMRLLLLKPAASDGADRLDERTWSLQGLACTPVLCQKGISPRA